jgi:phage terminase large subunit GpA-like protein
MTAGGKRIRRGVRLWTVAVSTFKSETYRFLRLERPTDEELASGTLHSPGTIHLPAWVESEWCKQFVAEQLVTVKTKRGFQRLEWQKLRERNEALDCRSYARAAAWIAGVDRWSEDRWEALETELKDGAGSKRTSDRIVPQKENTRPVSGARDGNWINRRRGWIK